VEVYNLFAHPLKVGEETEQPINLSNAQFLAMVTQAQT
jgi:hypothetical protein